MLYLLATKLTTNSMSLLLILRVVQILLLMLAISMTMHNIYDRYCTNRTHSVNEVTSLQSLEFPVILSIIITPGFNLQALEEVGYSGADAYFWGDSRYKYGTVGWAGHTADGGTLSIISGKIIN